MTLFDKKQPAVRVIPSPFGGGWIIPLTPEGSQTLAEYFDAEPEPLAPLGGDRGYMMVDEKNFCCGCGEPIGDPHSEDCDEGAETLFLNHYRCPDCKHEWEDEWSATCDDDCPHCGARHISPTHSEEL